ncbi:hypothetical protein [Amycolatopsis sp. NPDC051903]|uniref:hypothetical protein n=1 Tax=Amycolatopsis sp. NPDC051903 TaxID=3363936 RepID=UPI003790742C
MSTVSTRTDDAKECPTMATRYLYLPTTEFTRHFQEAYGLTLIETVWLWDAIESAEIAADDPEDDLYATTLNGVELTFRFELAHDGNSCVVRIASTIPGAVDEHLNEEAAKLVSTR